MAASEALNMQGDPPPTTVAPTAVATESVATAPCWPHLIPIAQLIAVVLAVFAIIWNQQQATDNLRTELSTVEAGLRAEISSVEAGLKAEISGVEAGLKAEISKLRAEVAENGQRLARIEGFLGIGIPEAAQE